MKRKLPILILPIALFALSSCSGSKEEGKNKEALRTRIDSLEGVVDSISSKGELPKKEMRTLMDTYKKYADRFPEDSLAPHQLFRAGSVARSLKEPQRAINIYRRLLNDYPDFSKEATVRFLLAFVYDQDLGKKKRAKELYRVVIDSFPDHQLAKDAKEYLRVMDLSNEELIRRFEKQQAKRDSMKADSAKKAS
jgi:tetratricopeptide (TPR) repeat protein